MKDRTHALLLTFTLLSLMIFAHTGSASTVTANVLVYCPFSVKLHPAPLYPQSGNITVNYSIKSTSDCDANGLTGSAKFYNPSDPSNMIVINISTSSTPNSVIRQLSFNSLLLEPGIETGNIRLSNQTFLMQSNYTATFEIEKPASLSVTSLSVPSIYEGSPLYFYINVLNSGGYSAQNITASWSVKGPLNYSAQQPLLPLSGNTSYENVSLEHTDMSSHPGTYTLSLYLTYNSIGIRKKTQYYNVTYTISQHSGSAVPLPIPIITKAQPYFKVVSAPTYVLTTSNSTVSQIAIMNPNNSTESLNFEIPNSDNFARLSFRNASIGGKSSLIEQLYVNASELNGSAVIPLNISASIDNQSSTQQYFIMYTKEAKSPTHPSVSMQLSLLNGTQSAYGTVQITAPPNLSINNTYVETSIPARIVGQLSHINATGLPSTLSEQNGSVNILWYVPYVRNGSSVSAYFSIINPQDIQDIPYLNSQIFQRTLPAQSILKLISISSPVAHPNTTIPINVKVLYTGTATQNVLFQLQFPLNVTVVGSSQEITASPDELLNVNFYEQIGSYNGTMINMLQASTNGSVIQQSVPVVVLAQPPVTTTVPNVGHAAVIFTQQNAYRTVYIIGTLIIIAAILSSAQLSLRRRAQIRHNEELGRMRERFKRR